MLILIDGYNLLNSTGIMGRGKGPGSLERARTALLNVLAESLAPEQVPQTTVVFDARDPPLGLPRRMRHHGLVVMFSARDQDADTLIEELIRADSAPRRLTVVSSDHRIQRAAHRRKSTAVDSDLWFAEVLRQRQQRREAEARGPERPSESLLAEEVDYWVRQFGGEPKSERPPEKPKQRPFPEDYDKDADG